MIVELGLFALILATLLAIAQATPAESKGLPRWPWLVAWGLLLLFFLAYGRFGLQDLRVFLSTSRTSAPPHQLPPGATQRNPEG